MRQTVEVRVTVALPRGLCWEGCTLVVLMIGDTNLQSTFIYSLRFRSTSSGGVVEFTDWRNESGTNNPCLPVLEAIGYCL